MPDYKKLYFDLFRANAAAVQLLIAAQQQAENAVLAGQEPPLHLPEAER